MGGMLRRRRPLQAGLPLPYVEAATQPCASQTTPPRGNRAQAVSCLASHPSAPVYVAAGQGGCVVWGFGEADCLSVHRNSQDLEARYSRVCFGNGGARFAGLSERSNTVALWSLASGSPEPYATLMPNGEGWDGGGASDACLMDVGNLVAVAGPCGAAVFDTLGPPRQPGGVMQLPWNEGAESVAILQNGPYIVLGGREGGVRIFDIRSERVLKDLQSPHTMAVKAIAVHGTGTGFATGSLDGSVNVVSSSRCVVTAGKALPLER